MEKRITCKSCGKPFEVVGEGGRTEIHALRPVATAKK